MADTPTKAIRILHRILVFATRVIEQEYGLGKPQAPCGRCEATAHQQTAQVIVARRVMVSPTQ